MTPADAGRPCGLLILDKPTGPTSHDCVARVRRRLGTRQVGHSGTLDPLASGVLVIAVGPATRLVEYLVGADKEYLADVVFGVQTDSYDADGAVTAEVDASALTAAEVAAAMGSFGGIVLQVPPPVSAVKVGGRPSHARHRAGESVALAPRSVVVKRLELLDFAPGKQPRARLLIACGSGFYVRSLAHDLGRQLGCGAHLAALRRTRVGPFDLDQAVTVDDLELHGAALLRPAALAVAHLPAVSVGAARERLLLGQRLGPGDWSGGPEGGPVVVRDAAGELLAIGEVTAGVLRPRKVLAALEGAPAARAETRPPA